MFVTLVGAAGALAVAAGSGTAAQIFLDELTTDGRPNGRIMINPNDMATSFSSKSELAVNLSPDGKYVTWLGYGSCKNGVGIPSANATLVEINDNLAGTSRPSGESFKTVETATFGQIYRGVTFTPGTDVSSGRYGS